MPFEALLIHRLEVKRPSGRTDRFGQPVSDAEPFSLLPCRATRGQGGQQGGERMLEVYNENYGVVLKQGDVREDDEVVILDKSGNEIMPQGRITQKRIVYDGIGVHHIELAVEVVRGPR